MESEGTRLFTISEAAKQIGVSVATLRRWADRGLIPVTKLPSGYRRFSGEQIGEIKRRMVAGER